MSELGIIVAVAGFLAGMVVGRLSKFKPAQRICAIYEPTADMGLYIQKLKGKM